MNTMEHDKSVTDCELSSDTCAWGIYEEVGAIISIVTYSLHMISHYSLADPGIEIM